VKTGKVKLAAFLALLIVLVTNCNQIPPKQVERIVVAADTTAWASPLWVAEKKGYFKEEGLNVEIREFESGRTALRTMLGGESIDISTASQTPVVSYSFTRADYAIIGTMSYSDKDVSMLARRDRGISATSDLKGKSIGVTGGSTGHFFLSLFLAYEGLRMADVKTVDIEATHLPQALAEGQVDAIATWEPYIYKARKSLGDKALLLPAGGIYRTDFYFIARKAFIKKYPEALTRFLRAIEKGEDSIRRNKKEAMDIVSQRVRTDREIMHATWDDFQFRLFLDQSMLVSLEDQARWAIANKLTNATQVPNYLDYIYVDALKAVKPGVVTIAGK
jgi:ABC-type nitrate/sulfonate/bicarbonate transport system substrate-binding protein